MKTIIELITDEIKNVFAECGYDEAYAKAACESWIDVRAFGQVFAFKGNSVSVGVRGPVTIQSAFSVDPIDIESIQITKSVNSETSHDTMGMKHRVNFALYTVKGSINHQLADWIFG